MESELADYLMKLSFWSLFVLFYIGVLKLVTHFSNKRGVPKLAVPDFNVPDQLSPSAARYVYLLKYDLQSLVASLLHLYINNYIAISIENTSCTIRRLSPYKHPEQTEDQLILQTLFGNTKQKLVFDNRNKTDIKRTLKKLRRLKIKELQNRKYFMPNIVVNFFIIVSSSCFYLFSVWTMLPEPVVDFAILAGITTFLLVLFFWFQYLNSCIGSIVFGIVVFIFAAFTSASMEYFDWTYISFVVPIWATLVVTTWTFTKKMKILTRKGITAKVQLRGLLAYLRTAEMQRYQSLNPHSHTLETKEALVPYAVALGITINFAKRLEHILEDSM